MAKLQSYKEFVWNKYGRVTVVSDAGRENNTRRVVGKCDCGKERIFNLGSLKHGRTKSCGYLDKEKTLERATKHGLVHHPLYRVWFAVKARCYNENDRSYQNYGNRGVRMCDEWKHDFICFYTWCIDNGWRRGLDLDKDIKAKDGVGMIYSPQYCSFVSRTDNLRSTRRNKNVELNGEIKCITEWAVIFNIKRSILYKRIKNGWAIEKLFSPPLNIVSTNV